MVIVRRPSAIKRTHAAVAHSFGAYREAVVASFLPLDVLRVRTGPFQGRLRSVDFNETHLHEVTASSHQVLRTDSLITGVDKRFYKASLQVSGTGLLIQDGREALLQPGDLALYDTARPYSLVFEQDMRMLVLMFPREHLGLPTELMRQLTANRFSSAKGVGAMTIPFLQTIAKELDTVDDVSGSRLMGTAVDLIATMLADELDLEPDARDSHHLLMQQIRLYIESNLGSPDLGPAQIAAAHFISTRHLHGLFHHKGTTVSTWIRERRLENCRLDLTDPLRAHSPIGAIAKRWGFVEAAHFSRVFKAAFGVTPSELRSGRSVA